MPGPSDTATFNGTSAKNCTVNVAADVAGFLVLSGYAGSITPSAPIATGTTGFTMTGGTFVGGANSLYSGGPFSLSTGAFTAPSGLLEVRGDFTVTGGTFTHNSGRVVLSAFSSRTINIPASPTFNDLHVNGQLRGYWKMDSSTPEDSSGYLNNGTLQGGAVMSTAAPPAPVQFDDVSYVSLNGSTSYVSIPAAGILDPGGQDFSVAAWIYIGNTNRMRVVNKWDNATQTGWHLDVNTSVSDTNAPGNLRFHMKDGTTGVDVSVAASLVASTWTHVAATINRSTLELKLYKDKVQVGTTVFSPALGSLSNTQPLAMGTIPSAGGNYFNGRLDEVRYYARILDAAALDRLGGGFHPILSAGLTYSLAGTGAVLVARDLTLSGDALDTGGREVQVGRNWVNQGGSFVPGTSTVSMTGSAGGEIITNVNGTLNRFYELRLSAGVSSAGWSLKDAMTTSLALTISNGILIQRGWEVRAEGGASIAAIGTWRNHSTGDVTLGGNVTVNGAVNWNGGGPGEGADEIVLSSTSPVTPRVWSGPGVISIVDCSLSNQQADRDITAYSSTSSLGNDDGDVSPHWIFAAGAVPNTWTGASGVDLGWGNTLNWLQGIVPTTETAVFDGSLSNRNCDLTSSGSIGGVDMKNGFSRMINVADFVLTVNGAVTLGTGSTGTISISLGELAVNGSLVMSAGTLSIVSNGRLRITSGVFRRLAGATFNPGTGEVVMDGTAGTLDVNGAAFNQLHISSSGTVTNQSAFSANDEFTLNLGSFDVGANDMRTRGLVSLAVGTTLIRPGGGTWTFPSIGATTQLDANGASLGTGPVVFGDGGAAQTIILVSAVTMNTVTIDAGDTFFLDGRNWTATSNLFNNGTVRLRGNETVTLSLGNDIDSGTFEFVGDGAAGTGLFFLPDFGTLDYFNLKINSTGGSPETFQYNSSIDAEGTVTVTSGFLRCGSFVNSIFLLEAGSMAVNGGSFIGAAGPVVVKGPLTVSSGGFQASSGLTFVEGDFTHTGGSFTHNGGRLMMVAYNANRTMNLAGLPVFNHVHFNADLALYLNFDEGLGSTTGDQSGFGLLGTLSNMNTAAAWVTATAPTLYRNPYALDFDGVNDYVEVLHENHLNFSTAVTVAAWIYADVWKAGDGRILLKGDNSSGNEYELTKAFNGSTDVLRFRLYGLATGGIKEAALPTAAAWHHVAGTYDGTAMRLYVDGVEQGTGVSSSGSIFNGGFPLRIGTGVPGVPSEHFDGKIEEVRLYRKSLSGAEILKLAQGRMPGTTTTPGTTNFTGGDLNVDGDLFLNSSSFDAGSLDLAVKVKGSWINNGGVFVQRTGTVELSGAGTGNRLLSGGQRFFTLLISGLGTWTADDGMLLNGNFTMTGGSFDPAAYSHRVAGNWGDSGGAFQPTAGEIILDGTGTQTIASPVNNDTDDDMGNGFFNLTSENITFTSVTPSSHVRVRNILRIKSGMFHLPSSWKLRMGRSGVKGQIIVEETGGFRMSESGTPPQVRKVTPAPEYSFLVNGSSGTTLAQLDLAGGELHNLDLDGLVVGSFVTILNLRNAEFRSPAAGALRHLDLVRGAGTNLDCPGMYFDSGATANVRLRGSAANAFPRMTFEQRSTGTAAGTIGGPGGGEALDDDGDTNSNGVIDGVEAADSGIVQWVFTDNTAIQGQVLGFPVAAFDWNTFAVYSTYVVSRDASGTMDRLYALNSNGDVAYYYEAGENFQGVTWFHTINESATTGSINGDADTTDTGLHVVFVGTSDGKIRMLYDSGTALVQAGGVWSTPFTSAGLTEVTSPVLLDRADGRLYFGGFDGTNYGMYGVTVETKTTVGAGPVSTVTRVETTPSRGRSGADTYLFSGTRRTGTNEALAYRINTGTWMADTSYTTTNLATGFEGHTNLGFTNRLYIGETDGEMHSVTGFGTWGTAPSGSVSTGFPFSDGGSIKGGAFYTITDRLHYGNTNGSLYILVGAPAAFVLDTNYFKVALGASLETMPLARGGRIYVPSAAGKLFVVDEATRAVLLTYDFGAGALSDVSRDFSTGRIRVGTSTGKFFAVPP